MPRSNTEMALFEIDDSISYFTIVQYHYTLLDRVNLYPATFNVIELTLLVFVDVH